MHSKTSARHVFGGGFIHIPVAGSLLFDAEQQPVMDPAQFVAQRVTIREQKIELPLATARFSCNIAPPRGNFNRPSLRFSGNGCKGIIRLPMLRFGSHTFSSIDGRDDVNSQGKDEPDVLFTLIITLIKG